MLAYRPITSASHGLAHALWRVPCQPKRRIYTSESVGHGSVSYLRNAKTGAEIYLVGTAHVSAKSADEVLQVINEVKPSTIAVELCVERASKLMAGQENETQNFVRSIAQFLQTPGGLGQKVVTFAIKYLYAMLRNTGLEPGKEFKVACEEAQSRGAKLIYIDQDYKVTMRKLVDAITFQDVLKILTSDADLPSPIRKELFEAGQFEEVLERMKTRKNVRAAMSAMEKLYPKLVRQLFGDVGAHFFRHYHICNLCEWPIKFFSTVDWTFSILSEVLSLILQHAFEKVRVMIHERDKLMVSRLRECQGKVVGVVGMAHMDGIERLWMEAEA